eukprot:6173612-Pleurochrysis_carterae.AAC.3
MEGGMGLTQKLPHSHALALTTAGTHEGNGRDSSIQIRACVCVRLLSACAFTKTLSNLTGSMQLAYDYMRYECAHTHLTHTLKPAFETRA